MIGTNRYIGSPALAEDGVGAITLEFQELPPVSHRQASGRGDILLFEEAGTNAAMIFTGVKGDADAAFRDPDYVRRERFSVQRIRRCRWSRAACLPNGIRRKAG
jgi:aerobic carbon-monoxide dehydrogenase large subunit